MRPRTDVLGRHDPAYVSEKESNPLASAPAQGRRRAVRAQSLAILHKVGCSWPSAAEGEYLFGSAGPTTPPRFEPKRYSPSAAPSGEPTVSHEGCSGRLLLRSCSSRFPRFLQSSISEEESFPLASAPAQGRRRAVRAQSLAILHKVGCSWPSRTVDIMLDGSAGPTTPPRFEPSSMMSTVRPSGEPTVSHEGCSGDDSFSTSCSSTVNRG